MDTLQEAINYPKGDIRLRFCGQCGFIWNDAFDPRNEEYSARYEEVQTYSPTFLRFQRALAEDLIRRFALSPDSQVLEIGCGKGEFLALLCELAGCRGTGFDPSYHDERLQSPAKPRLTFIADFYSEQYSHHTADLICCKMTLEHIQDTAGFLSTVRRSIAGRLDTAVFFQVPAMERILAEAAFWDVYYEHCSYFCRQPLETLFAATGFAVRAVWTGYDNQYLMIEAVPAREAVRPDLPVAGLGELRAAVDRFSSSVHETLAHWSQVIDEESRRGRRIVLWGGGSKAVAFLTTLGAARAVDCVVDVNPNKQGTFLAGTGHEIVAPEALLVHPPDVVILMNPIYRGEVQHWLDQHALAARLLALETLEEVAG
jgi:SAM-dependent methyltransferase